MINLPEAKQILEDTYYLHIEDRLIRISLYLGIGIVVLSLLFISLSFVCSFLIGAIVSYYNFIWMKQGVDRMLLSLQPSSEASVSSETLKRRERRIIFKYFIRYALIAGTLYAIFRFRFFDAKGAILGLLLFVIAVLYECIYQVIKSLIEDRERGRT